MSRRSADTRKSTRARTGGSRSGIRRHGVLLAALAILLARCAAGAAPAESLADAGDRTGGDVERDGPADSAEDPHADAALDARESPGGAA